MSYGQYGYGQGPYGSSGIGTDGPFLVETNPVDGSANVALGATVSFKVDSEDTIDPDSLNFWLDGSQAIVAGLWRAGFGGTFVVDGTSLTVSVVTHPNFVSNKVDGLIQVEDLAMQSASFTFSFFTSLAEVSGLKADTFCDGKRIDLSFTLPSTTDTVRIVRSKYAFCKFVADPGIVLYEGTPTNLDASPMTQFVDGVFSSAVVRTTNVALEENTFYYYTIFVSYNGTSWHVSDSAVVEGLSIKDYYSSEGDYVYALLPTTYKQRDADPARGGDQFRLRDFCRVIQCAINLYRGWTESLLMFRDPDAMPAGRLGEAENQTGLLGATVWSLGLPPEKSFDAAVLRRLALGLVAVWKIKGTCPGFVDFVKLFTGWDSRCDEQVEPVCGINRLFQTWDGESYLAPLIAGVPGLSQETGAPPGKITINFGYCLVDNNNLSLPLTNTGELTCSFIIDALGTFVCVSEVIDDSDNPGDNTKFLFNDIWAKLRAEITGSGTSMGFSQFQMHNTDYASNFGGWPWQFPVIEPKYAKDALKGLYILDSANTKFLITANDETTAGYVTVVTVASGNPATGVFSIAYDFIAAGSYAARRPIWHGVFYVGEFSLVWNPTWDIRLKDERYAGPWSLLSGMGSINALGFSATPVDLVVWVDDQHEVLSTVTAVTPNILTDDNADSWAVNQWRNYYVNPNWSQGRLYRVIGNTNKDLIVEIPPTGGLTTVSFVGSRYIILSEENALKYTQLLKLLPKFAPHETRTILKFESSFIPGDVDGLVYEYRADRGTSFVSYPSLSAWQDQSSLASTRDLAQATASKRPTHFADNGDGGSALQFDGTNDFMIADAIDATIPNGDYTVAAVVKPLTNGVIFSTGKAAGGNGSVNLSWDSADEFFGFSHIGNGGTALSKDTPVGSAPLAADSWWLILVRRTGTVLTIELAGTTYTATPATPGTTTIDQMTIFATAIGAGYGSNFGGFVRHLIVWKTYLSNAELTKVRRFLKETWPGI